MTKRIAIAIAAAATLATAAGSANAVELLVNGGFDNIGAAMPEGWGGLTYYTDGTHVAPTGLTIPGWTVTSGSVDLTSTGSYWGPADSPGYSLDINGWDPGTITQSFGTVLGRLYTVAYAYSRNLAGAPDPATATVSAGGVTENVIAALNDPAFGFGSHGMLWKHDGFTFVGTGQLATIELKATTGGNGGVFFDSISVTAVPEPAAWALMIAGFGFTGAALRRRRTVALAA